jgi:RHS repeat-associated protein
VVRASDGFVAQRLDYDTWGRVLADTNPAFQPFAYAGGLYDPATGLVRFGARDYDARVGRWTARDPVLFGGGQGNLYAYVGGDPINRVDPSGLVNWTKVGDGSIRLFVTAAAVAVAAIGIYAMLAEPLPIEEVGAFVVLAQLHHAGTLGMIADVGFVFAIEGVELLYEGLVEEAGDLPPGSVILPSANQQACVR